MEAVVIIIVPVITLFVGVVAVLQSRPLDVASERERLNQHIAWLESRLHHAREKRWDAGMVEQISGHLERARRDQAALRQP